VALIDLTDMQSEKRLAALTKDLSLFGCSVKTVAPFPEGSNVRLRVTHAGVNLVALGKVAYSRPGSGMGIAFIKIEPSSLSVLDAWLAGLRKQ
jgi:ABC-type Na+ transport system ATPase subunit NatA